PAIAKNDNPRREGIAFIFPLSATKRKIRSVEVLRPRRHIGDDYPSRRTQVKRLLAFAIPVLLPTIVLAQAPADATQTAATAAQGKEPLVEFEMMTWPEVKQALAMGKTTALFYTGGTEQRG